MKHKKKFINNLKEFFLELLAHCIVSIIFLFLLAIGFGVLKISPDKVWNDLPFEIIAVIGFLAFLAILHILQNVINTIKKWKHTHNTTNNQQESE